MRILCVTPYYPPDLGPSAPMVRMLCEDLAALGNAITVVSAVPHFPTGLVPDKWRRRIGFDEQRGAIRVCRVRIPSGDRSSVLHRAIGFAVYQALASAVVARLTFDVALVTNPAVEAGLPFATIDCLHRLPVLYCVWDLYPEAAVAAGVIRNRIMIRAVQAAEDYCLRRAAAVQVLTYDMLETLVKRGVKRERLARIPVWLDLSEITPGPRDNPLSRQLGLSNRFVVLYAGNMGFSQGLEVVLEAAERLRAIERVRFVMVGDGAARPGLEAQALQRGLDNVIFLSFLPRERLPELLASCDAGLVSQRKGLEIASIPSKTFNLLAAARPVIACVQPESELARLLVESGGGTVVSPGSGEDLANTVVALMQNEELRLAAGGAGRAYLIGRHDRVSASIAFDQLLRKMAQ